MNIAGIYRLTWLAMAFAGSSQLQLLLTLQFPDGMVRWGATILPSESVSN